jgi:site-specific recombinase XerD
MSHDAEEKNGSNTLIPLSDRGEISEVGSTQLPNLIMRAGDHAARRFVEFFGATIRNQNTREAYGQAIGQFCQWCEARRLEFASINPIAVAAYIENLLSKRSAPTVKQHLAAIRMLFDWMVIGHVVRVNPAWS